MNMFSFLRYIGVEFLGHMETLPNWQLSSIAQAALKHTVHNLKVLTTSQVLFGVHNTDSSSVLLWPPELKTKVLFNLSPGLEPTQISYVLVQSWPCWGAVEYPLLSKLWNWYFLSSPIVQMRNGGSVTPLIWPKIIQLLTANILEPSAQPLAIPIPLMDVPAEKLLYIWTQLQYDTHYFSMLLSSKIKNAILETI